MFYLFRFPKDPEQRKRWVIATKRKGFIPTDKSALCSRHFDEADFEVGGLCRRLKKGAVPTIFDFPAHVQPNPPKRRRIINKIKVRNPLYLNNGIIFKVDCVKSI